MTTSARGLFRATGKKSKPVAVRLRAISLRLMPWSASLKDARQAEMVASEAA